MMTAAFIRKYINGLSLGSLFTTRDCLSLGTRAAVDQALYRLVKAGYIVRVAFGVFMKPNLDKAITLTAYEVARVKAESFARRIVSHARDAAQKLGLADFAGDRFEFATNGSSSSFKFGDSTIFLRQTCPRKMLIGDRNSGPAIRALWHLGEAALTRRSIAIATSNLKRWDRHELRQRGPFMPAWLYSHFAPRWT